MCKTNKPPSQSTNIQLLQASQYCEGPYWHHPQGYISFVSEAWGGSTSDKHLTENCGLLDKLLPGDLVMADRGFTIHDGVALKHAQLVIPAFTKGKEQLDPIDVEKTKGIAHEFTLSE